MGKGDRKSWRGKLIKGSYGKVCPKPKKLRRLRRERLAEEKG